MEQSKFQIKKLRQKNQRGLIDQLPQICAQKCIKVTLFLLINCLKIHEICVTEFLTSSKWFEKKLNAELTFQALVVALGEEEHGLGRPLRGLQKALAVGILTQAGEQKAIGTGHFRQQGLSRRRAVVQLHVVVECAFFVACNIGKIFAILKSYLKRRASYLCR
jgi:hypothetical protein